MVAGNRPGIPVKPDPTGLFAAVERLGVRPEECLYCGDSWVDVDTGKNAGMPVIGAEWGFRGRKELEENHASYVVDHPEDILKFI